MTPDTHKWQADERSELRRRRFALWADRGRALAALGGAGALAVCALLLLAFFSLARLQSCGTAATAHVCERAVALLESNEEAAAWLGAPIELRRVTGSEVGSEIDSDELACFGWVEGRRGEARLESREWLSDDGTRSLALRLTSEDGSRDLALGPLR